MGEETRSDCPAVPSFPPITASVASKKKNSVTVIKDLGCDSVGEASDCGRTTGIKFETRQCAGYCCPLERGGGAAANFLGMADIFQRKT